MITIKMSETNKESLRHQLDQVPGKSTEDADRHRERIEGLRADYPHTIEWVEAGDIRIYCYEYALGICPEIVKEVTSIFPCILNEFVDSAMMSFLEKIEESEASTDAIIIYFNEGRQMHAGYMEDRRVVSKWGLNPVYKHEIFEVPAAYGNEVRFFRKPADLFITIKFIEFVRCHPRYIDVKELFEDRVTECGYVSFTNPTT